MLDTFFNIASDQGFLFVQGCIRFFLIVTFAANMGALLDMTNWNVQEVCPKSKWIIPSFFTIIFGISLSFVDVSILEMILYCGLYMIMIFPTNEFTSPCNSSVGKFEIYFAVNCNLVVLCGLFALNLACVIKEIQCYFTNRTTDENSYLLVNTNNRPVNANNNVTTQV